MPGLSQSQLRVILSLVEQAPDHAIRSLDMALSNETVGAMGEIRDLVAAEAGERRARHLAFAPVVPLCPKRHPTLPHERFPSQTLAALWRALKATNPDLISICQSVSHAWTDGDVESEVFDVVCAEAAQGLRELSDGPFAAAFALMEDGRPGGAELFARYLDLAPIARQALRRLPEWVGRMTDERAASARLAFRDAVDIAPDAGPRFFEILLAHADEPWTILRVASTVMDHPSESYFAGSELASIGERLMDDVDRRLESLRAFDPTGGRAAGEQAGEDARIVVVEIAEFEQTLDIKKDGPWGQRLQKQKRHLAQSVEVKLKLVMEAVDAALPLRSARINAKRVKGVPSLGDDPQAAAVAKAESFLVFVEHLRLSAPTGGYASARTKLVEALEDRLDQYAEDLIEELRKPDSEHHDRASAFLELTATFVGHIRDEKAAQILRRRAAA